MILVNMYIFNSIKRDTYIQYDSQIQTTLYFMIEWMPQTSKREVKIGK